jgi:hypothetical protein
MHRGELKRELVRILEEMEFDDDSPEATADSYLDAAARNAGVVEERGPDVFAFWHPTFEEYLAGVDLCTPTSKAVARLCQHADDPRWRDVILLGVGYVGLVQSDGETASEIVRALLDNSRWSNPLEGVLRRRLRLAAACVADDVGVKRNLAEQVIVQLGRAVTMLPYEPLTESFVRTVRALPRLRPSDVTINELVPLVGHPNSEVRMEAARLFGNAAIASKTARELCDQMSEDPNPDVCSYAAVGLARVGEYSSKIWSSLGSSLPSECSRNAPAVLDFLKSAPRSALVSVRALLLDGTPDDSPKAAELLARMGCIDESVVSVLSARLSLDEPWLQLRAVELLVKLGRIDDQVAGTLRSWLSNRDSPLRFDAARLLEDEGRHNDQVVSLLHEWLTPDDPWLCFQSARLLEKLGRADDQVASALQSLLPNGDSEFGFRVAEVLGKMTRIDGSAASFLRSCVLSNELWLRAGAADLLVSAGEAKAVVSDLRTWLSHDEPWLRVLGARSLVRLGCSDEHAISVLHSFLSSSDARFANIAAEALAELGHADEQVLSVLRSWLVGGDLPSRARAMDLLRTLARAHGHAASALCSWLSDYAPRIRSAAATLLEDLAKIDRGGLSAFVTAIDGNADNVVNACWKLQCMTWPDEDEAQALAAFFTIANPQPDREWLYSWVDSKCSTIQQKQSSC